MRSDYALYTVAIIFFILTGIVYFYQVEYRDLWIVTTTVLGLFFIGLGYTQRPKITAKATETPAVQTEIATTTKTQITPKGEPPSETLSVVMHELTEIKGIGAKRAEQLKALGFVNVDDLAKASAEDLALKLKVSPKITRKWIEDARKLLEKS
ncbi:MAG: helix-hairpin-helix domain-containing protein [Candidatus Bathyarchaeia archaeon]